MKKIIVSALALILVAGAAQAQVKDKTGKQKGQHERVFGQLNLTDAQKTQLKNLHKQERSESEALKKNDQMIVKDWKAKRKEIHERYRTQFQSILTQEQKDKLATLKSRGKYKGGHFNKKRGGMAFDRQGKMAKDLGLTVAQQQKMQDLRKSFKTKAEALKSDKNLTHEQKKTQFQELMKQQKEQMKTVLTQEQLQKMESHMKDRRGRDTK